MSQTPKKESAAIEAKNQAANLAQSPTSATEDTQASSVSAQPESASATAIDEVRTPISKDDQTQHNTQQNHAGLEKKPLAPADNEIDPNVIEDDTAPPKEPIPSTTGWSPKKKSLISLIALISLLIIGTLLILYAWKLPPFIPTVQQTDNAFIKGKTTIISPQVSGYVTDVIVGDFESVQAGDVLVKIDDRNFAQQLEQAQANIDISLTDLASNSQDTGASQAQIDARIADLNSAKVKVASAQADVARYQGLLEIGAVSQAEVMHTKAQLAQAQAAVEQAKANIEVAVENAKKTTGSKSSLDAKVKSAEAAAKQAQISLENSVIKAPESGQLSQVSVKTGQYVNAGSQLMYIVPDGVWVIANFKETQVKNMQVGETATIRVDGLGGQNFTGRVSSLSPATGSELSAGAANPATGNYIKVAQRIPVRIDLDPNQNNLGQLRPGMSVVASVDTQSKGVVKSN